MKETTTQVFSCGYCKIFKNTYFEKHLPTDAPGLFHVSNNCGFWFRFIERHSNLPIETNTKNFISKFPKETAFKLKLKLKLPFTIILRKNQLRRDAFYPEMIYLYGKHCPSYAGILRWASGIPPRWKGMKNIPSSYKRNNKLEKKLL